MFSQTHLSLQTVRLKPHEKWTCKPNQIWFVFPKQGEGQYLSRTVTRALTPGDVLVLDSTCESQVRPGNSSDFVFCCFSAFPEHIFPLFSSNEIGLLRNILEGFKSARLHSYSTALAQESHRLLAEAPVRLNLEHRGHLLRVMSAILEAETSSVQPHLPGFVRAEDHLLQVLENVSAEDLMNLSVAELATKFGWSQRHLNRMFHAYFGLSAEALKMEMRLLRAVSLLRDPDAKIIGVAELCGFNYLGFFNACFKRRFGVTPSQYRKVMAEADGQPARFGARDLDHICPLRSLGLACDWAARTKDEPWAPRGVEMQKPQPARIVPKTLPPRVSSCDWQKGVVVSDRRVSTPWPARECRDKIAAG